MGFFVCLFSLSAIVPFITGDTLSQIKSFKSMNFINEVKNKEISRYNMILGLFL